MIRLAKKLALKSEHKQHHHAVIITKGGKIIATGYNHKFMHAEMDAIRKIETKAIRRGRPLTGLVMYSFRFRKGGSFGNAKPCKTCDLNLLLDRYDTRTYEFDAVYYTNEQGELTKL